MVIGQKCQVTSFNKAAFTSFGKEQTLNASLCLRCGMFSAQGLESLLKNPQNRSVLMRDDSRGAGSPLRNQMTVYWLKEPATVTVDEQEYDLLPLLTAPLPEKWDDPEVEASLALLEKLLKTPWSADGSTFNLPDNAFYLAVISANKGRLVLREWIAASLIALKDRLKRFLAGLRLVGPQGEPARAFPVPVLAQALGDPGPNLVRGLLRTAYLGAPPPPGLLESAVKRLRTPRGRILSALNKQPAPFQVLAAVLKLALTFGKQEAETMERLNPEHLDPAYLCGRLLAVLEEAQRRAASGKLNTTLVDRFYGAAATAPAASFAPLLKLAHTAHLPKIRREQRGYQRLSEAMSEIMTNLEAAGGFPRTLSLMAQAEFALGYYHQRAALSTRPKPEEE